MPSSAGVAKGAHDGDLPRKGRREAADGRAILPADGHRNARAPGRYMMAKVKTRVLTAHGLRGVFAPQAFACPVFCTRSSHKVASRPLLATHPVAQVRLGRSVIEVGRSPRDLGATVCPYGPVALP